MKNRGSLIESYGSKGGFTWVLRARAPARTDIVLAGLWVILITWAALLLQGCSGTPLDPVMAPGGPASVGCYTTALERADKAAHDRCGGVWSMCEHRSEILARLDSELERCDIVMGE